jgi:hypothetical protein
MGIAKTACNGGSEILVRRALNLQRRGALFLWFDEQIHAANRFSILRDLL